MDTVHPDRPLILASASPRRQELIALLGIPYRITPPAGVIEDLIDGMLPDRLVVYLANKKALWVAQTVEEGIVLGADTIVVCEGSVLGKPQDEAEAMQMLRLLNGREHQVFTGLALLDTVNGQVVREQSEAVCTRVWFRRVDDQHLSRYVQTGEPLDKAGAYGAQGYGSTLIERIEGCYFNVVGLPVSRVGAMLESWGIQLLKSFAIRNE